MKIFCVDNNFKLSSDKYKNIDSQKPIYFFKPDTTLLRNNTPFFIPDFSIEIQYEVELVLKINRLGKSIQTRFAHRYFEEIGIGIDFTAHDIKQQCIEKGLPWEPATSFDYSSAISKFLQKSNFNNLGNIQFHLDINGITVQHGNTADMILNINEIIHYLSKTITFRTGDLIYTGTPKGSGLIKRGDRLQAYIENMLLLDFFIK